MLGRACRRPHALSSVHPHLVREWDVLADAPLRPDRIKATNDKAVRRICPDDPGTRPAGCRHSRGEDADRLPVVSPAGEGVGATGRLAVSRLVCPPYDPARGPRLGVTRASRTIPRTGDTNSEETPHTTGLYPRLPAVTPTNQAPTTHATAKAM